ncbi:MAG: 4Fe-4S binding protein, partial [Eubacteriales bacterium]|nr:4Fe-4S binding protein [Eubacteriales bacterium]
MSETNPQEEKQMLVNALSRMLHCRMPAALRESIEALLARTDATVYELKSAYANYARRVVLARPRAEILWNPTVDAEKCVGCGVCFTFCPHGVYAMRDGVAAV